MSDLPLSDFLASVTIAPGGKCARLILIGKNYDVSIEEGFRLARQLEEVCSELLELERASGELRESVSPA